MANKMAANLGLLARCYEGLRNWRALVLLSGGFVAALLLAVVAGMLAARVGVLLGLLVGVIAALVYLAGLNGAGLLVLDQVDGKPARGIGAGFFGGLHATLTVFLSLVLLSVGLLVVFVVIYVLSLLGHIPGIGPFFVFVFAGPSAVVLAFCYALLALGVPLVLAAVWRSEGTLGAIGKAVEIIVRRPLDAMLHFIVLGLIILPVVTFVFGLVSLTSGASVAMYAGSNAASGLAYGAYGYGYGMLDQVQQLGAAGASVGVVLAVLVAMFTLVGMFGYILVYDSLGAGLASDMEDRLRGGLGQLKKKLDEHRPQAAGRPTPRGTDHCAHCGTTVATGDQFCGACGQPRGG